ALQTASIATGLPFAIILLVMCYSLYRGLNQELVMLEKQRLKAVDTPTLQPHPAGL
ncbi:MAG: BCCT family transporter, partial [Phormidesmis sp.]